jgi:hypothetical protein
MGRAKNYILMEMFMKDNGIEGKCKIKIKYIKINLFNLFFLTYFNQIKKIRSRHLCMDKWK